MTVAVLARQLTGLRRLTLDASVFLAAGDPTDPRRDCALWLLRAIEERRFLCTISTLTASELVVRALQRGRRDAAVLQTLLQDFPGVDIRALTLDVAVLLASVRAIAGLRVPDACVVAQALASDSQALVHSDRDFSKAAPHYPELRFIDLGRYC